ncbi:hypothetical protein [Streptomyces sp. NEAU-S77]|uniref:hypothetical protein n=1 Tax=Streptomyces sp. NEAU-S77 TaxID=3411033 RepID=UPI003B9E67C5
MSPATAPAGTRGIRLAAVVVGLCWMVVLFDGLDLFIYGAVLPGMLDDPQLGLTPDRAGTSAATPRSACCWAPCPRARSPTGPGADR